MVDRLEMEYFKFLVVCYAVWLECFEVGSGVFYTSIHTPTWVFPPPTLNGAQHTYIILCETIFFVPLAESSICESSERNEKHSIYSQYLYKQLQNVEKELRLLGPSSFSKSDGYNRAVLQVQGMKNLLEPHVSSCSASGLHTRSSSPTEDSSGDSKKCCQKGLPWWFVFVGWFLVVATSGVSAYFTMIYGLTYGKDRSISWLISMVVSFFESLFITQPVKVRDGIKNTIQLNLKIVHLSILYITNSCKAR